jgi:hypothetical protein
MFYNRYMNKHKPYPADSVCKPCWELKYCPYGSLVEYFPGMGGSQTLKDIKNKYKELLGSLASGRLKTEEKIWECIDMLHYWRPGLWEESQAFEEEDVACKIFGHICPVFFHQSVATETKNSRPQGRYIPRDVMLKVVRRDNHVCQICHKYVPDDQVEFDHIIPFGKGGPTTVENLRLLHRSCNRKRTRPLESLLK